MLPEDLDDWLPKPSIRVCHRREARATCEDLWQAAESVRLNETGTLSRLVRWRIPGTPPDIEFQDLFARYPFIVLAKGEHWSVSGMAGRLWTLKHDYPRLEDPSEYAEWNERGTARVLFAHWVEDLGDGRSALVSESRIKPVGNRAAVRLKALWAVVGKFERFIGGEALALAARRAEGR